MHWHVSVLCLSNLMITLFWLFLEEMLCRCFLSNYLQKLRLILIWYYTPIILLDKRLIVILLTTHLYWLVTTILKWLICLNKRPSCTICPLFKIILIILYVIASWFEWDVWFCTKILLIIIQRWFNVFNINFSTGIIHTNYILSIIRCLRSLQSRFLTSQ